MSYTMSAQVIGAKELDEAFRKAPQVIVKELGDALKRTAVKIASEAMPRAPINYGVLRASLDPSRAISGPQVTVGNIKVKVGSNVKYAPFMEYGTRPHFPPVHALRNWARHKLGNEKLAFLVARAIARKGTRARLFFKGAIEDTRAQFSEFMREALARIVTHLARA